MPSTHCGTALAQLDASKGSPRPAWIAGRVKIFSGGKGRRSAASGARGWLHSQFCYLCSSLQCSRSPHWPLPSASATAQLIARAGARLGASTRISNRKRLQGRLRGPGSSRWAPPCQMQDAQICNQRPWLAALLGPAALPPNCRPLRCRSTNRALLAACRRPPTPPPSLRWLPGSPGAGLPGSCPQTP